MNNTEDYYRTKANECDTLADEAKDPEARRMLREAADNWRTMAERAERMKFKITN
jgi:hypothetical protein